MNANFQPYEGKEPYIFVSYARKDSEQVIPLLEALSGAGYRVWYDKGIQVGRSWADTLAGRIKNCAVFMPLISSAFADSAYCYDETSYARYNKRAIVPVYLEKGVQLPPGLDMVLHDFPWLEFLPDRAADAFTQALDMESICALCKDTPETRVQEAS